MSLRVCRAQRVAGMGGIRRSNPLSPDHPWRPPLARKSPSSATASSLRRPRPAPTLASRGYAIRTAPTFDWPSKEVTLTYFTTIQWMRGWGRRLWCARMLRRARRRAPHRERRRCTRRWGHRAPRPRTPWGDQLNAVLVYFEVLSLHRKQLLKWLVSSVL